MDGKQKKENGRQAGIQRQAEKRRIIQTDETYNQTAGES